jgi:hypothetical protein
MAAALRADLLAGAIAPLRLGERRTLTRYETENGVAELEIVGRGPGGLCVFVHGPPFQFDCHLVASRGLDALRKKRTLHGPRQTDLVLAIFFDMTPYGEGPLEEMRVALYRDAPSFREVWVVSPFSPGERADRLWPS